MLVKVLEHKTVIPVIINIVNLDLFSTDQVHISIIALDPTHEKGHKQA